VAGSPDLTAYELGVYVTAARILAAGEVTLAELCWAVSDYYVTDVRASVEAAVIRLHGLGFLRVEDETRPTVAIPPWCGECDHEHVRFVPKGDDGPLSPCPRCHPDPAGWEARRKAQSGR